MPTVITHALVGAALGTAFRTPRGPRLWLAGAACAVLPDADVVAFWYGLPWGHPLGHRGITHSLPFAVLLAAVVVGLAFRARVWDGHRGALWLFLFLATASHGLLDALTDGGPGVAFFAPFESSRYFLPWQPIPVSPIGIRRFLGQRGLDVLAAETLWIWVPTALGAAAALALRPGRRAGR